MPTKDVKIFVSNNHQFTFVPYLSFYDRQVKYAEEEGHQGLFKDGQVIDRDWESDAKGLILVRHPLTRLYSSWANRFSDRNPVVVKAYTRHTETINHDFSMGPEIDGPIPPRMRTTFVAFIRFICSDVSRQGSFRNYHWLPIDSCCDYCNLRYEYVINQEDAGRQTSEFLRENGILGLGPLEPSYDESRNKSGGSISQDLSGTCLSGLCLHRRQVSS